LPEEHQAEQRVHGTHYQKSLDVRVNSAAFDAFMARKPLPVGSVVVKERHNTYTVPGPPDEYTAMIKKDPGYNPESGDWEYRYVVVKPEKKVVRGKLQSCMDCHQDVKTTDFRFRTYLPHQ